MIRLVDGDCEPGADRSGGARHDNQVLHEQPEVAGRITTFLLARNIQIDQLFSSSERRLDRLLLLLANFGKEGKWKRSFRALLRKLWRLGLERRDRGSISS